MPNLPRKDKGMAQLTGLSHKGSSRLDMMSIFLIDGKWPYQKGRPFSCCALLLSEIVEQASAEYGRLGIIETNLGVRFGIASCQLC